LRLLTAGAEHLTPIRRWDLELQQLTQCARSGLMQAGTQSALDGLQIGASAISPLGENAAQ
jgi:hypothetical protein